jgi:hypothetical protein
MKRILLTLLALTLCLSVISSYVYAEEIDYSTREAFEKLQEDGIVGYDVSYEEWVEIIERSKELEKEFEENENFELVYDGPALRFVSAIKHGDVIVTNCTSSFGITGHVGIAINYNEILHIGGTKEKPSTPTVEQFKQRYKKGWIKVYRPVNFGWGVGAASWAVKTYKNSNAVYKITDDITSTKETYCSKIVFQAYKYGAGEVSFKNKRYYSKDCTLVFPYDLKFLLNIECIGELDLNSAK